ncbi:Lin1244/Lin1753 domain-containing protein [Pseudotamlana agarivorans]|uniref:Lin1244/Lin1753 domain-containing protein n=1 Tax=Pseudotamlana agarivorans TaxID=481183 RepID=UPI000836023C|nr:Lin1244/Lin1753 domain-containing protein [Tamlana agarivorans]
MAKKNKDLKAVYFSHDCNARNDEKIILLRMKHGALGYGVYFMLLERLGSCTNYAAKLDYDLIAYELREDSEVIKSVIENFGLFEIYKDKTYFYSKSFISRMAFKDRDSVNGIIGNLIRYGHATKEQLYQLSNDEIIALNNRIKSNKSGANSGANSGGDRNKVKEVKEVKENKESELKEVAETPKSDVDKIPAPVSDDLNFEKELTALQILKKEKQQELDILWSQNHKNIKDKKKLVDTFNNKMEIELSQGKIDFVAAQLMPRFKNFVIQWTSNSQRELNNQKNGSNEADRMYSKMKRL